MRNRVLVPVLALCATLAGCSKPLSPVAALPGRASLDAVAAAGDSFRVRLEFSGTIVTLDAFYEPHVDRNRRFVVTSVLTYPPTPGFVPDTVPVGSVLRNVRWERVATAGALGRAGALSLLGEAPVVSGAAAQDMPRTFPPGWNVITLQAPPRAGGGRVQVAFVVDFAPVAWWAGPDPALWPRSSDGDGHAVDVTDWASFTTAPAWPPDNRAYFGPDSFAFLPSRRVPVGGDPDRRTFYELFGSRVYARAEGDTVHANAVVAFSLGGYDQDSPYAPRVVAGDPGLPPGYAADPTRYAALLPQDPVGSPSAYRHQIEARLADGTLVRWSQTTSYPDFDPASVFRSPNVAGYAIPPYAGRYYVTATAVDAEGMQPALSSDVPGLVDRVDAGGGTALERAQRRSILTFFVRAPAAAGAMVAR